MQTSIRKHALHALALIAASAALAAPALAGRVGGEAAPSAQAVQGQAAQPAHVQGDESASLRQGTITALDAIGARLQVQGVWLAIADGKTVAIRNGKAVEVGTLRVGETIRFTVAAGSAEAASLRVIYAP